MIAPWCVHLRVPSGPGADSRRAVRGCRCRLPWHCSYGQGLDAIDAGYLDMVAAIFPPAAAWGAPSEVEAEVEAEHKPEDPGATNDEL